MEVAPFVVRNRTDLTLLFRVLAVATLVYWLVTTSLRPLDRALAILVGLGLWLVARWEVWMRLGFWHRLSGRRGEVLYAACVGVFLALSFTVGKGRADWHWPLGELFLLGALEGYHTWWCDQAERVAAEDRASPAALRPE